MPNFAQKNVHHSSEKRISIYMLTFRKLIFVFISCLFLGGGLMATAQDVIVWKTTLADAQAESARTERPIFFNCYVDWAGGSVLMDSVVLRTPTLSRWIPEHFVPLRIDMRSDEGKALARQYGITSYAYYLVLDAEGDVIHRISGGAEADVFQHHLEAALNPATSLRGSRQRVESGQATAADTAAYLRALRTAGDGETFRNVGQEFALRQAPESYLSPDFWPFAVLAMRQHTQHFAYLLDHKAAFEAAHGAKSVEGMLESVLCREVRPWAEGQMQPIAARSDLDKLLAVVRAAQLSDTTATSLLADFALLRTDHRYAEALALMTERGHILGRYPGVRSGIELTFRFPDMTAADTTALIAYFDAAVARETAAARGAKSRTAQQLEDFRDSFVIARGAADASSPQSGGAKGTTGVDFEALSFEAALQKAAATGKLVFMDCQTVWCGPCRAMARDVFPLPRVGEYFSEHFVSIKQDMETGEGPDLSRRYKVTAYPTMLILDVEGNELHRIVGYRSADALLQGLEPLNH